MIVVINVSRYVGYKAIMGILSMMFFNIYIFFFKTSSSFFKLMGTGKNGTFDIHPDFGQWAFLGVWESEASFYEFYNNSYIKRYIDKFSSTSYSIFLSPIQSHGKWDGREPFGNFKNEMEGEIAVLTRATIKFSKLKSFWRNVPLVSKDLYKNEGLMYSIGIGEVPFIKQATFSVWKNAESMKKYAYQKKDHKDVISKTKSQGWYSEELFSRFKIIDTIGDVPVNLDIFKKS